MIGTVVLWNDPRGYGFIRPEGADETEKVFVHITNCQTGNVPKIGARVQYELGNALRLGQPQQAIQVKLLPPTSAGVNALEPEPGVRP